MPSKAATFSSRALLKQLRRFPAARRYLIGLSGGADSTALLVAMARQTDSIDASIEAVHFDHGLNSQSTSWQRHCEELCQQLGLPLTCHSLDLSPGSPDLENNARNQRYQWVESQIDQDTIYLTAHNADDRAETLLLNALRGSGLEGMASIPEIRPLGKGQVARPLLGFFHEELARYLETREITWIEDPSNQENHQDRNFIRNEIFPALELRWPATRQSLAHTSEHLRGANNLLRELLTQHYELSLFDQGQLPLGILDNKDDVTATHVVREWLRRNKAPPVPETRLLEFLDQLRASTTQSRCEMSWQGWAVRLFRGDLWLLSATNFPQCPQMRWQGDAQLNLGPGLGTILFGKEKQNLNAKWTIGPRQPGAAVQLHPDGPDRKLKKVISEQGVPPWQRMSVPVLYRNGSVMAIGDWQFAPIFSSWTQKHGLEYRWVPEMTELRDTQARCLELAVHA